MLNETIVWLTVVLVLLRDLEQVVMFKAWLVRDERRLQERSPSIAKDVVAKVGPLSTASLAVIAAAELIIITILALSAINWDLRELWAGVLVTWGLFVGTQLIMMMVWRLYWPGGLTSMLSLPFFPIAWTYLSGAAPLDMWSVAKWALAVTILSLTNGAISRRLAGRFETWLKTWRFSSEEGQQVQARPIFR